MNDEVQSIINEVCNKRIGIGQTDNDKWWLHQMWVAQHKIADYLMNNDYKQRIDKAIDNIEHELNGHILLNDEITWNKEFYTNGKLDYRKLLISLLQQTLDILKGSDTNE